jgi:deoxyadenosine/deoxycytidine kinase
MSQRHYYIAVAGTMGSGKTTAAGVLARESGYTLMAENFAENTFLPRFYQDMKRWSFHSETFFLMEKCSQLLSAPDMLRKSSVVQDTPIEEDVYGYTQAQHELGNLDDDEWRLYQKIYRSFVPYFPKLDLLVYLKTSVPVLAARIKSRGLEYEKALPVKHLELLDALNGQWLARNTGIPVLTVETDKLDIVRSDSAKGRFIRAVTEKLRTL